MVHSNAAIYVMMMPGSKDAFDPGIYHNRVVTGGDNGTNDFTDIIKRFRK